jgi:HIRAN domain-containing protein
VNVAGETHYQDALHAIAGDGDGEVRLETTAALLPEPANPHDPNAVRVEIGGALVGYLPRAAAVAYGAMVREPAGRGRTAVCDAMVAGRGGLLGVFLKLPEVE